MSKTHEETRTKPLNPLSTDEKHLLKTRFREATKFCHPDVVAEAFKEKASRALGMFIELKQAYDENNLARVTALLDYLKHGKPYTSAHTALNEKRHLRTALDRLRNRRAQLLDALHRLRQHDTFDTIQSITDWNTYFDNQKAGLDARLDKLILEWKRINK